MSRFAFKAIQELRIHFCQTSSKSAGLRQFVKSNFAEMKKANPALPIMVRECEGATPKITARYDMGIEKSIPVADMDEKAIDSKLKEFC
mmetsp:Transcript_7786/g.9435  ORF Transcript_7786/g.9435 Transcript_7786/m.9435 type:complete len:89 (+) Transcript_7786:42-308(+)|eukprot:jgi/Bigna1/39560/e_gw1.33.95.1